MCLRDEGEALRGEEGRGTCLQCLLKEAATTGEKREGDGERRGKGEEEMAMRASYGKTLDYEQRYMGL